MTGVDGVPACVDDGSCITCSDQGLVLRIVGLAADGLALCVDETGRFEEVQVDLIDSPGAGDVILVHARVALVRLARAEVRA
ncbi:MAG: hydrogenase assembly protein HupF [Gemmatimonadales bacterium]